MSRKIVFYTKPELRFIAAYGQNAFTVCRAPGTHPRLAHIKAHKRWATSLILLSTLMSFSWCKASVFIDTCTCKHKYASLGHMWWGVCKCVYVECMVSGSVLPAHRAVLVARCDVMAAMFSGKYAEARSRVVPIHGVSSDTFLAFLEYLYTDTCCPGETSVYAYVTLALN